MFRRLLVVVALAPLGARAQPAAHKVVVDRVAAVVNDAVILASELEQRMTPLRDDATQIADPTERERRLAKLSSQMVDEMVTDELILQAGRAAGVRVEASEVHATLDYIREQHHLSEEQFQQAMAAEGVSAQTIEANLLRQRAINQLVGPKLPKITDDDLRQRYAQIAKRAQAVSAISLSHMLFAFPEQPTPQDRAAAKARATAALDRVKAGESFADVAKAVSDDATTKATGGELGWVQPGSIPPEWDDVVFGMDPGDVRGPMDGAHGYELFHATDVKRGSVKSFADMKHELAETIEREELTKLTKTWVEALRQKAYIDVRAR